MIIHTYEWQEDGEEREVMAFRTMRELKKFRTKMRARSDYAYFNDNEFVKTHDVKPNKQGVIDFFNSAKDYP